MPSALGYLAQHYRAEAIHTPQPRLSTENLTADVTGLTRHARPALALAFALVLGATIAGAAGPATPRSITLPFDYDNGFIVVEAQVNGSWPLRLLFDTGSKHTILTEPLAIALLNPDGAEAVQLVGSDLSDPISGLLSRRNRVDLGTVALTSHTIIATADHALSLAELTSQPISGILGIGSFGAYAITINYRHRSIRLVAREHFRAPRGAFSLPIDVVEARPFLSLVAVVHDGYRDSVRLLLDTGAGLELLLYAAPGDTAIYPARVVLGPIAQGLGGQLHGYVGRSDSLNFGAFALPGLVTHFQIARDSSDLSALTRRSGLLGNRALERFRVCIDYPGRTLYLVPEGRFAVERAYDRSGLRLVRDGATGTQIRVQHVTPGSPAAEAGVRSGDRLTAVGRVPTSVSSLARIHRKLRGRVGRRVRLRLDRDGQILKIEFRLRELI